MQCKILGVGLLMNIYINSTIIAQVHTEEMYAHFLTKNLKQINKHMSWSERKKTGLAAS